VTLSDAPELKIPSDVTAVVAEFTDRRRAEEAVDRLTATGFGTDQISFIARGAETVEGRFVPGTLMITVHASGRDEEATQVLREAGASTVKCGTITATGDILEEGTQERAEATV
jgi:hypothetical protein